MIIFFRFLLFFVFYSSFTVHSSFFLIHIIICSYVFFFFFLFLFLLLSSYLLSLFLFRSSLFCFFLLLCVFLIICIILLLHLDLPSFWFALGPNSLSYFLLCLLLHCFLRKRKGAVPCISRVFACFGWCLAVVFCWNQATNFHCLFFGGFLALLVALSYKAFTPNPSLFFFCFTSLQISFFLEYNILVPHPCRSVSAKFGSERCFGLRTFVPYLCFSSWSQVW